MPPKRKETGETSSALKMKKKKKQLQGTENGKNSSSSSSNRDNGEEEEDRISCLPKAILHHILSFLDMKHVVQTSILSKRWTDLWASLSSLTFDSELFDSHQTNQRCDEFLNFVEQVLLLRDNSEIDTFLLINVCEKFEIKSSRFNTWIVSVIRRKVKHLYIDVLGDGLRLPNRLFTCNSLTSMILVLYDNGRRWSITLPADSSMCLPNLLKLLLDSISFNDENLTNKFFSSCPNLERLFLIDVEFLHMNVNVSCLKLRIFHVANNGENCGYYHWPNSKFKLHAPDLLDFSCNDFMSNHYILENLTSLIKADIDMKVEEVEDQNPGLYSKLPVEKKQMYARQMMQYLRALLSVKVLKLSAWFLEVISGSPDLLEGEPTELLDLYCLRLETWLSVDTFRAIAYLLKISPNIESLFLQISQMEFASENVGDYPEAEMSLHCLLDELEVVEIKGVVGCANELNFLQALLKNAKALKKLVVYTSTDPSPDRQKQFIKFTEKLLMFPRASSNITILFF